MDARQFVKNWKEIVDIYEKTQTPKDTVDAIIASLGTEQTKEVFATVAAIKKHDGRIGRANRQYMDSISTNPRFTERSTDNPILYAGLDDIHTAHIDQMITELRALENRQ